MGSAKNAPKIDMDRRNAADVTPEKNGARRRKLSEVVAEQLMEEIKSRKWPVGESLGTESELMARFNVSRATIVEAARQVERHGAATMRRGSGGGLVVLNSAPAAAARAISTYLELSNVSIAEVYEAARVIETETGKLAAASITEEQAVELRAQAAEVFSAKDNVELHSSAMRLRLAVAELTGNAPLTLFMRALARVITDFVRPDVRPHSRDLGFEHRVAADMSAIVASIVAGDVSLTDHHIRTDVARREQRARVLAVAQPLLEVGPLRRDSASKLAETIAVEIRNDILRKGMRPGERLASESNLPARYGVSQWVLRQAIRVLELHGLVRMQRGQGGGLFVAEPTPDYCVEVAVSFLHGDIRKKGLQATRLRLFQSIAQFAAIRSIEQERERLVALTAEDNEEFSLVALLDELAVVGKNRVLALFGLIMNRFIEDAGDGGAVAASRDHARALVESITSGDASLARRRLTRFLEAV